MKKKQSLTPKRIIRTIEEHKDEIHKFGVRKIGLFGSFIRNEQKPISDIDLLVSFSKKTFDNYMGLKLFLEGIFKRKVDLVMPKTVKPDLKSYIMRDVKYAKAI